MDAKHAGMTASHGTARPRLGYDGDGRRFARGLVGFVRRGGAKLHRSKWGAAVENLTGTAHSMDVRQLPEIWRRGLLVGSKNSGEPAVDAHE